MAVGGGVKQGDSSQVGAHRRNQAHKVVTHLSLSKTLSLNKNRWGFPTLSIELACPGKIGQSDPMLR